MGVLWGKNTGLKYFLVLILMLQLFPKCANNAEIFIDFFFVGGKETFFSPEGLSLVGDLRYLEQHVLMVSSQTIH